MNSLLLKTYSNFEYLQKMQDIIDNMVQIFPF